MSIMSKVFAVLALLATSALAQPTNKPSDAQFVYNNQGRPLAGASIAIADLDGEPVVVYAGVSGTTPFNPVVPASGLVQFFGPPGYYRVTVSGQGVVRTFYSTIRDTVAGELENLEADIRQIAVEEIENAEVPIFVSVDADEVKFGLANDPALSCSGSSPCALVMGGVLATGEFGNPTFEVALVMPPYPLTTDILRVRHRANSVSSSSNSRLRVEWCQYGVGENPCTPGSAHQYIATIPATTQTIRYLEITPALFNMQWNPDKRVRLWFTRLKDDPLDTYDTGTVSVEGVDFVFSK